ncbi:MULTISPECIES: heparinase II/III domain-containing protein [Halomonadaceae]|uniref:heparinase II/III domain-containing protein n=1 Tax=Halomonadaceae TaxID=28256 RepID=UPI00158278D6|nr:MULTISPECIES: heparinase II/III family protein [Halomonas]MDI4637447.1 heparinase II/III family protein [Halomonas sp. BMC7]NUJ61281.1 alginate lyase family protein [Halomonas taeanensis]
MSDAFLVPVHCFLHRIFPVEFYGDAEKLVRDRVFKPRKDSEPCFLQFPLDWESRERSVDRNWRMQLQGWTFFHPIINIFDSYDNKDEIVEFFFDAVSDWWKNYGQDPEDIVTTRMPKSYAWYDMSVGFRALAIAFFINRIHYYRIDISEGESELLDNVAAKHIRHLLKPEVFSMNNHGLFQSHGLVGLLKSSPHLSVSLDGDIEYAVGLVERLVVSQFGDVGVHLEHSPHYHFYALNSLKAQIDSGWYDDKPRIKGIAEKADENGKWLVDPLKRPVCVGDSILTVQKSVEFPNSHIGKYVLSDFASSGYSVVRSGWGESPEKSSMLFFTGGYHTKSHKHRDCLSFDWFDQGGRVICDSGKYGYKSDVYRNYFLSSRAHNSVEIDGFDILKIKPYGSAVEDPIELQPGLFLLKGALDYPAVKHHREIYFKPGSWAIIKDSLTFARERGFKQWFHVDKKYNLESFKGSSICFNDGRGRSLYVECMNENLGVELHFGDGESMQGFVSEKDYQYDSSFAVGFSGRSLKEDVSSIIALSKDAFYEAKNFMSKQYGTNAVEVEDVSFALEKEIISGVENVVFKNCADVVANSDKLWGERTFQVLSNSIPFSFYGSFKEKSKRIAVFLPGATSRKYGEYDFQRCSWGQDLEDFDCVFFSDPSIKKSNDLTLGWFQHTESNFGIEALKYLITSLLKAKKYNQNELLIFGSSGGGFVSLKLSECFDQALVVAINPQIYLYNYTQSFYEKMVECCYEGRTSNFVKSSYLNRIAFSPDVVNRGNPVFIFQNVFDDKHYSRHFKPLLKKLDAEPIDASIMGEQSASSGINFCLYYDELMKHNPPNKADSLGFLYSVFRCSGFL